MDVIALAIASIVWGAVLVGVAYGLQKGGSLTGPARQALWRIAALLMIAPWIAAPLADMAGIGLPAPAVVQFAPITNTVSYESFSVDALPLAEPAEAVAPSPAAPAQPLPWQTILMGVIAAGWVWRFAAARMAAASLKRIVDRSSEAGPGLARQSLTAWSRKLELRREPRLRIVAEGLSPFSFGIFKPVICLPDGLERQLDREALDLVVAHECLHAARGDGWLRPLERLVADLLWFNPFAWHMRRELDVARELACDEAVLKHAGAHRAYAHTLRNVASIAAGLGPAVPAASMSLAGSPRSLMLRMKQALTGAKAKPAWTALAGVAVFGVTGTLAACMQGVAAAPRIEPAAVSLAHAERQQASAATSAATDSAETSGSVEPAQTPTARVQPGPGFDRETNPVVGVPVRLTAAYGFMKDPFNGNTAFHEGVDLAAGLGTAVMAPVDGVVSFAGVKGSYGRVVELDVGDGVRLRFAHLNVIDVEQDGLVKAGDKIGTMGSTGRSTGPHLHFEYFKDGKSYDPVAIQNLILATSLKIDLAAQREPAAPQDAPPAPSLTPIRYQQAPPASPTPLREITAWYPGRVTIAESGPERGFRVKVEQTAETQTHAGCWVEMDMLPEMNVGVGQELKVGDLIGSGAWGQINFGESCRRSDNAALDAIFPERVAAEERRFADAQLTAIRRGAYDPSLSGREIKAWYPAKVMVADGDPQTGYKVRLVQTRNTDAVTDCTVTMSNLQTLQVALSQTLNEGDVIGVGAPDNMTFQVACKESLVRTGRSPMLDALPELRNSRQSQTRLAPSPSAISTVLGWRGYGAGPIGAPFNARVTKVERIGELFAVDIEAIESTITQGNRHGDGCTARLVGLAQVSVTEGSTIGVNQTIGRQDAPDDFAIRCNLVRQAS